MCVRGDFATGIRDHDLRNCLRTEVLAGCGLGNLTSNDVDDVMMMMMMVSSSL